jgi:hypothetical protein
MNLCWHKDLQLHTSASHSWDWMYLYLVTQFFKFVKKYKEYVYMNSYVLYPSWNHLIFWNGCLHSSVFCLYVSNSTTKLYTSLCLPMVPPVCSYVLLSARHLSGLALWRVYLSHIYFFVITSSVNLKACSYFLILLFFNLSSSVFMFQFHHIF